MPQSTALSAPALFRRKVFVPLFFAIIVLTCPDSSLAEGMFGDFPRSSMQSPTSSADDLARRLLTGDLSTGSAAGPRSLERKAAEHSGSCGAPAKCLEGVAERAKLMPNIVFPQEVVNPR
ncbi:hypothetical protein ASG19_17840 [Rhizobium sp. Leaf306]|nr:hypothetical protein ASG19_17840 [Rhizobium sp. Leaf306]